MSQRSLIPSDFRVCGDISFIFAFILNHLRLKHHIRHGATTFSLDSADSLKSIPSNRRTRLPVRARGGGIQITRCGGTDNGMSGDAFSFQPDKNMLLVMPMMGASVAVVQCDAAAVAEQTLSPRVRTAADVCSVLCVDAQRTDG